jgi:uncharacterized protein YcgI (DUF1989 family)
MPVLRPQTGYAFRLAKGSTLKVIDPMGQQVSDLFCFSEADLSESLSSGRSIDYNDTVFLTAPHKLYSNRSQVMMTILEDSCGRHDFLLTPCSLKMFQVVAGKEIYHPSCHENLAKSLTEFGVNPDQISTTFNIFMNVVIASTGQIAIRPPVSKAGDWVLFRAEMDLIVGLTACSHEETNNGVCKPIHFEITLTAT